MLQTDKPSRIYRIGDFLLLDNKSMSNNTLGGKNQHIYIISEEDGKQGDYVVFDNQKEKEKDKLIFIDKTDGFGSQFQSITFYILYSEFNNLDYIHKKIKIMDHNYNNDVNFIKQNKSIIQLTDGSVITTTYLLENAYTKLSIDSRSHKLWRFDLTNNVLELTSMDRNFLLL